ncbi:permease of the drug/metabolite transporter (DMT) superfamily [Gottschalkia purinilytica]|uniref:Permease of the drug/metabolite transporter (DMT) superfamily n=1 Tax=Gottschalkia purinilytica TaxID=1503 RepID=A0A0L0W9T6_GOTPU|nr:DMT family transporter [Gottschalkia purinilytica]KNF08323.1 permease of the drug/metabolite transporter (DMT) superfamily [Gottschalkia purinilytica]
MKNKRLLGHLMAFTTILVWGTTFTSTKVLLRNLSPIEILFYRFLIAYLALLLIYPKFNKINNIKEELLFLSLGASGVTLYFLAENTALKYTLASNVGLLLAALPIITAILAHIFINDEKFHKKLLVGFIFAVLGVFLVLFNERLVLNVNPIGDILAIIAAVIFSVYSILLRKVDINYSHIYVTRKVFFYGLMFMVPVLLISDFQFRISWVKDLNILSNMLFLGLIASAVCYVMWNKSISIIGVVKTSTYVYLSPVITMIASSLILKEKVTLIAISGMLLILLGVCVSEHGDKLFKNKNKVKYKSQKLS